MADPVAGLHPPKVPLTIRVGVTGHRDQAISASVELERSIGEVLDLVRGFAEDQVRDARKEPFAPSGVSLRVVSPLAEGADQLVARVALDKGFDLQCPLPFPRATCRKVLQKVGAAEPFERLLGQAKAVFELDGTEEHRDEAYQAAGYLVLRQSDVLIAIWDGKEARGVGGTGQVVREALKLEIPVLWIDPASPSEVRFLHSADPRDHPGDLGDLFVHLRWIYRPPLESRGLLGRVTRRGGDLFRRIFQKKILRSRQRSRDQWDSLWTQVPEIDAAVRGHVDHHYRDRFAWADSRANQYGLLYRLSWISNYVLGALAVLGAFLAVREKQHVFSYVELGLIALVVATTYLGRRLRWHQLWMDCRLLAEGLRHLQVLTLFARTTPAFRVAVDREEGDPRQSWAHWYLRAAAREAGLANAVFSGEHLAESRRTFVHWAQKQAQYHEQKADRAKARHRLLSLAGSGLFVLAALACALHVVLHETLATGGAGAATVNWMLDLGVLVFPAFGAAAGAILHHGEYERMSARSRSLAARLRELSEQMRNRARRKTSYELGDAVEEVSQLMLAELSDFRDVFLDKPIHLPA